MTHLVPLYIARSDKNKCPIFLAHTTGTHQTELLAKSQLLHIFHGAYIFIEWNNILYWLINIDQLE